MVRLGEYESAGRLATVVSVGLPALRLEPVTASAAHIEYVQRCMPPTARPEDICDTLDRMHKGQIEGRIILDLAA